VDRLLPLRHFALLSVPIRRRIQTLPSLSCPRKPLQRECSQILRYNISSNVRTRLRDDIYHAWTRPREYILPRPPHFPLISAQVIVSTVLIHTLLFDEEEDQIREARSKLEKNFTILTRLRRLWPCLDYVATRLKAFHKACHTQREGSYRMDHWMLKFLAAFAMPIDEKDAEELPSPSALLT
jgi:hypothetical protein